MRALLPSLMLLFAGLAGCSPGDASDDFDRDGTPDFDDTDNGEDGDTDITPPYSGPSFWRLGGTLALADGQVLPLDSSISVTFTDDDGRPWQEDELDPTRCDFDVVSVADGPPDALLGEPLLGWWQLGVVDRNEGEAACTWPVPVAESALPGEHTPLVIGVGEFDSRLLPSLQAAGYGAGLDVYGLYLLHPTPDGDVLYVFGVAGTEDQFEGDDTTVEAPPLPNGAYRMETLVLLPVPEAAGR